MANFSVRSPEEVRVDLLEAQVRVATLERELEEVMRPGVWLATVRLAYRDNNPEQLGTTVRVERARVHDVHLGRYRTETWGPGADEGGVERRYLPIDGQVSRLQQGNAIVYAMASFDSEQASVWATTFEAGIRAAGALDLEE